MAAKPKQMPKEKESPELTLVLGLEEEDDEEEDVKPVKIVAPLPSAQPKKFVIPVPPPKPQKKESDELTLMLDLDDETDEEEEGELIEEENTSSAEDDSWDEWAFSGYGGEGSEKIAIETTLKKEKKAEREQPAYLSSQEDESLQRWTVEDLQKTGREQESSACEEKDIKVIKTLRQEQCDCLCEAMMDEKKIALRLLENDVWDNVSLESLQSEVSLVQQWDQENLVKVLGMHVHQRKTGYLIDYNPEEAKELERIWPQVEVTEEIFIQVALEILYALSYIHTQKIVHQYLNLENILLAGQKPFLLDAGLCTLHEKRANLQKKQGILSYMFMSPEQCKAWQKDAIEKSSFVDKRTDVYSLGVVLYWMLCFRFPYEEGPSLIEQILHSKPIAPAELDPMISVGLSYIVMKAIEKDPKNRYASAQEMITDLKQLIA